MNAGAAFDTHLATWRALEPEMQFAEPFVPARLRQRFRSWGTLLAEIERSAFMPSEPHVVAARLGWWAHELHQPESQHPVAAALRASAEVPEAIAHAAAHVASAALPAAEANARDTQAAVATLAPFGLAVANAEAVLFACGDDAVPAEPGSDGAVATAIAAGTLLRWSRRLPEAPGIRERLPLDLLARHGGGTGEAARHGDARLVRDLASALRGLLAPAGVRLPLYRVLRCRYDLALAERLAAGRPAPPGQPVPPPLRATLMAWRNVRRARVLTPI